MKNLFFILLLTVAFHGHSKAEDFSNLITFNKALDEAFKIVMNSPYKNITVWTDSGSISGEFLKRTDGVLIMREDTGSVHLKSNKTKVNYVFVNFASIKSIAITTVE